MNAAQLGVSQDKIDQMLKILEIGKMSFEQFNTRLVKETQDAQDAKLEAKFETMFNEQMQKRANKTSA